MEVIYQDDDLLIINKPAGLLTIPDGYNPLLPCVKTEVEINIGPCWIVHRLDKETSGVLVTAKNIFAHRMLNLSFQNRCVHKTYHAVIIGIPDQSIFQINFPLRINGDRKHRTIVDLQKGKTAITNFELIESFNRCSLIAAEPHTGYTHQIRVHSSAAGFPILSDHLYQSKPFFLNHIENLLCSRTALHAKSISFPHPRSNELISLTATYPEDFQNLLNSLKQYPPVT